MAMEAEMARCTAPKWDGKNETREKYAKDELKHFICSNRLEKPSDESLALNKLNKLHPEKNFDLPGTQPEDLRALEKAVLKGDLDGLQSVLKKYNDNPDAAKPMMNYFAQDMKAAGLIANYEVEPVWNTGNKAVGILSLHTAAVTDFGKDDLAFTGYTHDFNRAYFEAPDPDMPKSSGLLTNPAPGEALTLLGRLGTKNLNGRKDLQ
jgi:hypothetical protein